MPRRAALRLVGATFAGVWLAGFRAPRALAQDCGGTNTQTCTAATQFCRATCCPPDKTCCYGPPDPASPSGCVQNPHCCDPCDPKQAKCMGDGYCGPGPVAEKCVDDCKKRVDEFLKDYSRTVCRGSGKKKLFEGFGGMGEKAFSTFGCLTLAESILRPTRYEECQRDPQSNYTVGYRDAANTMIARNVQAGEADAGTADGDLDAIRRLLRAAAPEQVRLANRVFVQAERPPVAFRQPALARELRAYAAAVGALRQRVARAPVTTAPGRRARSLTVATLAEGNRGLLLFAKAVDTQSFTVARTNGQRARAAFTRAAKLGRAGRAALHCGATCT